MKFAASTVYEARHSHFSRHSRPKVGGREMMLRLANKPSPPENALIVQVIVNSHIAPWTQRASLVNFRRGDFKNSSTLSEALRNGQEPIEKLSGFKSTTRVTFVRVSKALVLGAHC
jgi:hypothetical protein